MTVAAFFNGLFSSIRELLMRLTVETEWINLATVLMLTWGRNHLRIESTQIFKAGIYNF